MGKNYSAEYEDVDASVKGKEYSLTFKENRSYELHTRNSVIRFEPRETKTVSESVVLDPDFSQSEKYFIVKEI